MTDQLTPGQILELRERARERLVAIPGVLGVGFGVKKVDDQLTEGRALRVYVEQKKPLDELAPDEVIPSEIDGVPTDVLNVPRGQTLGTEDTDRHSPLLGGITITNFRKDTAGLYKEGTLGCFATIDGASGPKNVVLMSNHHVLAAHGGAVGNTINQPQVIGGLLDDANPNPIAEINDLGIEGPHPFTYPSETEVAYHVDCATAKLNIDVSSWCDCNCGVSYKNEVRELNIGGNSKLEGVARAIDGETVHKSGRRTGRTQGVIEDPLGVAILTNYTPPVRAENVILINPANPPDPVFADQGDSGAALVNDQNKLIGLVFGAQDSALPNPIGFACHIAPVLDQLSITPISTANPPVGPAGHAHNTRLARVGAPTAYELEDHTLELQERLRGTPAGATLYDAFLEHRSEVVGLVNRHRLVTIAWHRGKGPTYFAHFAENARHPGHAIPFAVDGVTRRDLIERMEEALLAHGSEALRKAIREHREQVLALIDDFDDLHELVGGFEEQPTHA